MLPSVDTETRSSEKEHSFKPATPTNDSRKTNDRRQPLNDESRDIGIASDPGVRFLQLRLQMF